MIKTGIDYLQQGRGEPILFLHGIGGGAESFTPQLAELHHYHCIAWNMPGYANSTANVWPPSFASLSNTLHAFIDALGFDRVHLVGQSIGGMLALEHAQRHSNQVSTLTLIGTTPSFGGRDNSFKETFLKARLAPLEAGHSMAEIASMAAPNLVGPVADDACIAEIESVLSAVSEKTWRGILECLVTFNRRESLASTTQACCVIAGSHDHNAPAKTMQKMSDKIPVSQFHLIQGAGHMINQEAPTQTNRIINQFLGQHAI